MDIKDLNKSQLILLAILLSFITSIATGIVTVTLMQQAPDSVTVPINRIIKQTVEKIKKVEGKTTVNTVVIKEEDLVVDAIAKNQSTVFALSKEIIDLNNQNAEVSAGRGFAVSEGGIIVADSTLVGGKGVYYVSNASGKFNAQFISLDEAGFSYLQIGTPLDEKNVLSFTLPVPGDVSKMKIGQKIIVMGNAISSFIFDGEKELKINVPKSSAGGLVVNLDGEALGIALSSETKPFTSIDVINESLKQLTITN